MRYGYYGFTDDAGEGRTEGEVMKKIIALIILSATCINATIYTQVASGKWSAATTWDAGSGFPVGAADSAVLVGAYNDTLDTTVSISGLKCQGNHSGLFIMQRAITVNNFIDSGSGARTYLSVNVNDGGQWYIGSTVGVITATSCNIDLNGSSNFIMNKTNQIFNNFTCGDTTKTCIVGIGSKNIIFNGRITYGSGTVTQNGLVYSFNVSDATPFVCTPYTTINGSDKLEIRNKPAGSLTITIPKVNMSGASGNQYLSVSHYEGAGDLTVNYTDSIKNTGLNSGGFYAYNDATSTGNMVQNFGSYVFSLYNSSSSVVSCNNRKAGKSSTFNFGSSRWLNTKMHPAASGTLAGTITYNMGTSQWWNPSNWTMDASVTFNRDTSTVYLTGNQNNPIITSAGKSFWILRLQRKSGVAYPCKLGDSLQARLFALDSGKINQFKKPIRVDSMYIATADSAYFDTVITCSTMVIAAGANPIWATGSSINCLKCNGITNTWGGTLPAVTYPTVGPISYADSPISDTLSKAKNHSVTLGGCTPDSIVAITTLPTGYTLTKTGANIGRIAYNGAGSAQAATNYTIRAYGSSKTDSASVTISIRIFAGKKKLFFFFGGGK
jgi:hypothetical protein